MAILQYACIFSHKYLLSQGYTMCGALCSAGFYNIESKLISTCIRVWIARWMWCSMPYISFLEANRCLAWVGTEWYLNTSRFDPVALNDQQLSSESYRLYKLPFMALSCLSYWWVKVSFMNTLLEIRGTLELGQGCPSTKLYTISRLFAECWDRWCKNLPQIVVIICLYAQYKTCE